MRREKCSAETTWANVSPTVISSIVGIDYAIALLGRNFVAAETTGVGPRFQRFRFAPAEALEVTGLRHKRLSSKTKLYHRRQQWASTAMPVRARARCNGVCTDGFSCRLHSRTLLAKQGRCHGQKVSIR